MYHRLGWHSWGREATRVFLKSAGVSWDPGAGAPIPSHHWEATDPGWASWEVVLPVGASPQMGKPAFWVFPQVFPECPALSWVLRTQKWICHNSCPPGPTLRWERQTPDPQRPRTVLKWMWGTGARPGPGPCMGVCRGLEDSISGVSPREAHPRGAGAVHQQVPGKEAEAAQASKTQGWRLESPLRSVHSPLAP